MSSLPKAIKFRALADKLNDAEFNTFILKSIQKCGRDIVLTSLFNQFIKNSNQQTLNTSITIIKNIIDSRKPVLITKNNNFEQDDNENTSTDKEIWYKGTEILNRKWSRNDGIEYDTDPDHKQNDNKSHIHKGKIRCIFEDGQRIALESNDGTLGFYELEKICIKFNSSNIPLPHNTTIHSLPTELIGEIASYLNFATYAAFGTSDRSIYIGCNTPNTLRYLYLPNSIDYSSINIQKFAKLSSLNINLTKFNQLKLPLNGKTICNHLNELTLYGNNKTDLNIDDLIAQNPFNFNNITHLELESFGKVNDRFIVNKFCGLLNQFPMIQYLTISQVYLTEIDPKTLNLHQLLPNLQGFGCNGCNVYVLNEIVSLFGNHLRALSFVDNAGYEIPSIVTFSNLEELQMVSPTVLTLNDILKSAKNLRRIHFFWPLKSMINTELKDIMKRLISEQKSLQYLGIYESQQVTLDSFGNICDGIECGLYNIANKKNNFKVEIEFGSESTKNIETTEILIRAQRIITRLKLCNIPNFLFSLKFHGECNPNTEDWSKQITHFKETNKFEFEVYRNPSLVSIDVTNKESKINGWLEPWLLPNF